MKKLLTLILSFCIMFTCIVPSQAKADNTKLKLNKSKATMEVDGTLKLKLGDIRGNKVKWSSNNKKVATVSKWGVVTAKSEGTASIYAKYNNVKYKCTIIVKDNRKIVINSNIELIEMFGCELYGKNKTAFLFKNKTDTTLFITIKRIDIKKGVYDSFFETIYGSRDTLSFFDFVDSDNYKYNITAKEIDSKEYKVIDSDTTTTINEIENGVEIIRENKLIWEYPFDTNYILFFKNGKLVDFQYNPRGMVDKSSKTITEITTDKEYDEIKSFTFF